MGTPESEKSLLKRTAELLVGIYVLIVVVLTLVALSSAWLAGLGELRHERTRWTWGVSPSSLHGSTYL